MATDGEALTAGTIANPRLWRLGMLLDPEARTLTVAATSTVGEEPMLCRRIALGDGADTLRALEDAVYRNPMLLADFDRTTMLLRTPRFAVVPAEVADDADAADDAASLLWTSPDENLRLITAPVRGTDCAVLAACPADVAAFVGRTFADARFAHALAPEIAYFAAKAPRTGNAPKLFAVASGTGVDVIVFDGTRLLGATSYACGELPSGLLADGAAVDTPFPLVILPLCE